ncbi:MAG: Do family serine endopeptidase [Acidimicrobiales bacterium]|nr:Do family serine endopeptidase [Hyphomonadaceae bacterium]RZV43417.1 MAG: Do family serine endopeptidase [Acidimicrobiales bacterium]
MIVRNLVLASTFLLSASALPPVLAVAHEAPSGFVELAERLGPAVVNISTAQNVEISEDLPAFPKGSPLERFNDFFGGGDQNRISKSLGSGFVIDKDGFIVTNNHVIEGADSIEVAFPNGDSYEAELIGRDPSTDIAVLKIDAGKDMPYVNFAGADSAKVGEWVIAIGNPLGYSSSVAAGIVSARNRNISMGKYDDFIQTDVAINKGNSGGPLFNMEGDVVGVNTAIVSPTGFSVGLSFSIPADLAASVVDQLREYGETRRGFLGVSVQEVDRDKAKVFGLKQPYGALINSVTKDGPAEKAGLKRGDLITAIAGKKLEKSDKLFRIIAEAKIDAPLKIEYVRKSRFRSVTRTANVIIEQLEEKVRKNTKNGSKADEGLIVSKAQGIHVEALTQKLRSKYRLDDDVTGVRITSLDRNSAAAGKLRKGDIILEVAQESVENPEQFAEKMKAATESDVPIIILVLRNGVPYFYTINATA